MAQVTIQVRTSFDRPLKQAASDVTTYEGALAAFRSISSPIQRYLFLRDLCTSHKDLYWATLLKDCEEVLPYIYTPTVGEACENYHKLPLKTRGLYLSLNDKGALLAKLKAWPLQDVKVAVVTDGERILGLGDLGTGGMGISEGKISLYTAAAGVDPDQCLPICLDMGTNNQALLNDPAYKGLKQPRIKGAEFDAFLEEFMAALRAWSPHLLLQFEDFGNGNAFRMLDTYRSKQCCFNDDIQGTASITLAGLISAARVTGKPLSEHRIVFLGAGEAGTGIGQLIATYLHLRHGMSMQEAREHCYYLDSKGLICASRTGLQHHKEQFAHNVPYQPDLKSVIRELRPSILIGVSTIAGAFDQEVVQLMAELNERPIILPLSNPTSKAECTFEDAFRWTDGKVLFASGSPFDPISSGGVTYIPSQANNAYIFPAVGYAAVLTRATAIQDEVFVISAEELADMTSVEDVAEGRLFPPFSTIRHVSKILTARVAERMVEKGLGAAPEGVTDWEEYVASKQWDVTPTLSHL